jgi:hypothetical protein
MDKEMNAHISFLLNQLSSEYPQLSQALTRELKKRKGMTDQDKKIQKLLLLKSKHPGVMEELFTALNRKYGIKEKSGYKTDTFFSSPYIMSRVNSDPLGFPENA